MGQLILPNGLASQPQYPAQINRSNPSTAGLAFLIITDGVNAFDLVSGVSCTPSGVPLPSRAVTPQGAVANIASGAYYVLPYSPRQDLTGTISLLWAGTVAPGAVTEQFMSKCASNGASANPFDFGTNTSGANLNLVRANSSYDVWAGPTFTQGQFNVFGVTQGADISVAPTFYVNGAGSVATSVVTNVTGAATSDTTPTWFGRRQDGGEQLVGTISLLGGWNRVLSAAEMRALGSYAGLWQLVQAPQRRVWLALAASTLQIATSTSNAATSAAGLAVAVQASTNTTSQSGSSAVLSIGLSASTITVSAAASAASIGIATAVSASTFNAATSSAAQTIATPITQSTASASASAATLAIAEQLATNTASAATSAANLTAPVSGAISTSTASQSSNISTLTVYLALQSSTANTATSSAALQATIATQASNTATSSASITIALQLAAQTVAQDGSVPGLSIATGIVATTQSVSTSSGALLLQIQISTATANAAIASAGINVAARLVSATSNTATSAALLAYLQTSLLINGRYLSANPRRMRVSANPRRMRVSAEGA